MSEIDSGVDTGSESNESSAMCVESPPRSEDKEPSDIAESPNVAGIGFAHPQQHPGFSVRMWPDFSEFKGREYIGKMKAQRKKHRTWSPSLYRKASDIQGERKLRKAALANDVEQVQELLDSGIDPSAPDEKRRTALHFASCHGLVQIAQLLLDYGADPNQQDIIGNTPMHLAACVSNVEMVTLLLKAGTDLITLNNCGRTPIHLAQSKLRLLHMNQSFTSSQLKLEVMRILEMMQIYLQKSGQPVGMDLLSAFTTRLQHHQTREEVNADVSDLLSSLSHLSLQKA